MTKPRLPQAAPSRIAAVARAGDTWRLLVLRTRPDRAVESAQSFQLADLTGLRQALYRARADATAAVVPADQTVVRAVAAAPPTGTPQEVDSALALITESQLAAIAAHRRGAGVIRLNPAVAPVPALVALAWSGTSVHHPLLEAKRSEPIWIPEPLALAALASAASATTAVSADRASGSMVLIAGGPERTQVRTLCDDGSDEASWRQVVSTRFNALCAAAGLDAPTLAGLSAPHLVALLDRTGSRVGPSIAGAKADPDWLAGFGPALGAALALVDADPSTRALMGFLHDEPLPSRPLLVRAVDVVARPSRAIPILVACLALLLLWPLGVSWARYHYLLRQAQVVRSDQAELQAARKQAEFYQLLRDRRWPMTKLLADLTGSMPVGITLDTLVIETGQRLRVAGTTSNAAYVSDWLTALERTRIFDEVRTPDLKGDTFELTARAAQPLVTAGTPGPLPAPSAKPPAAATPAPSAPPPEPPAPQGRAPRTDAKGEAPKSGEPPVALTDEEIAATDRPTATREWGLRKGAASRPGLPADVKQRLLDEAEKLQRHRKQLEGGGQ